MKEKLNERRPSMIRTVLDGKMTPASFAKECSWKGCPICGLPAMRTGDVRDDSINVACRRCGGVKAYISDSDIDDYCKKHNIDVKYGRALISYHIHKEWLELDTSLIGHDADKIHYVTLDYEKLDSLLKREGPSTSEQIARCMELIGDEMGRNGRYMTFCFAERYGAKMSWEYAFRISKDMVFDEIQAVELIGLVPQFYLEVVRTLCVSDVDAVEYFFTKVLCDSEGFLDNVETKRHFLGGHSLDRSSFVITPKGWKFIEGFSTQAISKSVFVAMWFAVFTRQLRDVIRKVLNNKGYDPVFVDELPHRSNLSPEQRRDLFTNSTIDNMIISNIRRAKFVVADLSCCPGDKVISSEYKRDDGTAEERDVVCAGAYFEAGYATALEKPIIYLVHKKQTPHFDVNHIPYITWEENKLHDLEISLESAIEARGF